MEIVKLILILLLLLISLFMIIAVLAYQMKSYENKLMGVFILLYWSLFTYSLVSLFRMLLGGWL